MDGFLVDQFMVRRWRWTQHAALVLELALATAAAVVADLSDFERWCKAVVGGSAVLMIVRQGSPSALCSAMPQSPTLVATDLDALLHRVRLCLAHATKQGRRACSTCITPTTASLRSSASIQHYHRRFNTRNVDNSSSSSA